MENNNLLNHSSKKAIISFLNSTLRYINNGKFKSQKIDETKGDYLFRNAEAWEDMFDKDIVEKQEAYTKTIKNLCRSIEYYTAAGDSANKKKQKAETKLQEILISNKFDGCNRDKLSQKEKNLISKLSLSSNKIVKKKKNEDKINKT